MKRETEVPSAFDVVASAAFRGRLSSVRSARSGSIPARWTREFPLQQEPFNTIQKLGLFGHFVLFILIIWDNFEYFWTFFDTFGFLLGKFWILFDIFGPFWTLCDIVLDNLAKF